ncbi:MAG: hypothetical protein GF383_04370, partial [Candidatus Lokiarchaeota archaeon]|nr:hypothetical protein [Candidatus Lokiarchaeota archaeon]MBD3339009.1 hypothetical protein [Candidatus Lokiarchaeota archaeon]
VHARPIYRKGEIVGLRGTLTDITEKIEHRKLIEEQNLKLNELNDLKTELLRRTSHELKTPLVWIKGYSNLLLELHAKDLNSEIISIVKEIRRGSLKLEQLTGEILEASRLEASNVELHFSNENLSDLIEECVKEVKFLANKRNHKIIVDVQPNMNVLIEKEKIFEVITNLLTNAIKNTPSNGTITISSSNNNEYYTISVEDTGIGITEDEMPRLFTQFGKIERFGKGWDIEPGGTGLGLYIAKKIIELHGGKIWAQSNGRGKGSTFFFNLPIKNSN